MRVWPIMKPAPSLHSHSTAEAIYSGGPIVAAEYLGSLHPGGLAVLDQALLSARITVAPASGKGACGRKAYA